MPHITHMTHMTHILPSFEAPPPADIGDFIGALMGDDPIPPALVARMLHPERVAASTAASLALREQDWPNLGRYEAANAALVASSAQTDVVFMGDSLTELWPHGDPTLFTRGRVCRGISGQTTPQMLLRFQADVIAHRPRAVHLLGGTNDIAGNTGPMTPYRVQCNLAAMVRLAQAHGVAVILGMLPPSTPMPWNRELDRAPWTALLNDWLRAFAAEQGCFLVDYHAALDDGAGGLPAMYSHDGLHPNRRGYGRMRAVLEPVLAAV